MTSKIILKLKYLFFFATLFTINAHANSPCCYVISEGNNEYPQLNINIQQQPQSNIPSNNNDVNSIDHQFAQFSAEQHHLVNQSINNSLNKANNILKESYDKVKENEKNFNEKFKKLTPTQTQLNKINFNPNVPNYSSSSNSSSSNNSFSNNSSSSQNSGQGQQSNTLGNKLETSLVNSLNSSNFAEVDDKLGNALDLFAKAKADFNSLSQDEKKSLQSLYNTALNENGLLKDYLQYYPKLKDYKIKTPWTKRSEFYLKDIPHSINRALHLIKNSYSPQTIEKAEIAIENALKADDWYSKGNRLLGQRYSVRSKVNLHYLTEKPNNIFKTATVNTDAKNYFDLNKTSDTYENYSIVDLSNSLSKKLNKNYSDEFLFHAKLNLNEMEFSNSIKDFSKFEEDLDKGWALADFITQSSKGVLAGAGQVLYDTITGTYQLVAHPIDSVTALSSAIYNYDHTWNFIVQKFKADIDSFKNFHTLSTKEKAKLITQTSIELATLVTPRGLLKSTAQLQKIADASHFVSSKVLQQIEKHPSTPIGRRGNELYVKPGTNNASNIDGIQYSGHALDRMQGRGIPPSVVKDALETGHRSAARDGKIKVENDNVVVIISNENNVVTVIPK